MKKRDKIKRAKHRICKNKRAGKSTDVLSRQLAAMLKDVKKLKRGTPARRIVNTDKLRATIKELRLKLKEERRKFKALTRSTKRFMKLIMKQFHYRAKS